MEYVIKRNYVFVYFEKKEDVEIVIKEFYELELKGNVIRVLFLIILYKIGRGGGGGGGGGRGFLFGRDCDR